LNLKPTCKYFRDIVSRNGYLWREFEITGGPVRLSCTRQLEDVLRHSHFFRKFAIPYWEIDLLTPTIDRYFVKYLSSTNLVYLDLSGLNISTLCFLSCCPSLQTLVLGECKNLIDADFHAIEELPLTYIDVGFTHLSSETLIAVINNDIRIIEAAGIGFSLNAIHSVNEKCQKLEYFHLSLGLGANEIDLNILPRTCRWTVHH